MLQEYSQSILNSTLHVQNIEITVEFKSIHLRIVASVNDSVHLISLHDVHDLEISHICYPIIIEGLSIQDNSEKGWDTSSRYLVRDLEDEVIRCYCVAIDISELE